MKYIRIIIICLLILVSIGLHAQTKINGAVRDSIGNPLEMANIMIQNKTSGAMVTFSITDNNGNYKVAIPDPGFYSLKVSYLGFQSQSKEIEVTEEKQETKIDFSLSEENNSLNEIQLTYEMPVTIKGDTIIYNSDSFTNGNEKKLGDVLKKLPGVEINEDGQIEVEGKQVSKVMVEGKDFFDGDSKLATQNIPADAVSKIEVLKNYNEVSQLKGLGDDSDNVALNIKLKEGKKNFWFGDITAGAGIEDRYQVKPKLFYYSPKTSINILADLNNTGDVPFTIRDYFKFTGGFKNLGSKRGTSFNISDDLGLSFTQNDMAKEVQTAFGAVNLSHTINTALDVTGFAIYSDTETDMETIDLIQYGETDPNALVQPNNEIRNTQINQRSRLGLFKVATTYKPTSDFQLDYEVLLKKTETRENNSLFSDVDQVQTEVIQNDTQDPISVKQSADIYYTLSDKNIFAASLQYLYEKNDPISLLNSSTALFPNLIPMTNQDRYRLAQNKENSTNKFESTIDYYYVINKKSNINLTFGTNFTSQELLSSMQQIEDDGSVSTFEEAELTNDVSYHFSDLYLSAHYKWISGKFTFTPGLNLHQYKYKSTQLGFTTETNPLLLLPDLNIKMQLKKSESLTFNYALSTDFKDVDFIAEGYFLNSFNAIYSGNRNLDNALFHTASLNYYMFSMFNFTNFFASLNYSKRYDAIKSFSVLNGINVVSSSINSEEEDEVFSARTRYGRRFSKFKVNASANITYSTLYNIFGQSYNKSKSISQAYKVSTGTNFKSWPNFEIGYQLQLSDYENRFNSTETTTHKPFANMEVNFLKNFTFTSDYSYYDYRSVIAGRDDLVKNTYDFLDAALYYQKEDSPWEFKASVTNLLDTDSINRDSFSEQLNATTLSRYIVQPRYWMFTVKYDI